MPLHVGMRHSEQTHRQRDAGGDEADTRIGRRQTGLLAYDDPGEAAAYGVSIVVGQVTWNDADIPQ